MTSPGGGGDGTAARGGPTSSPGRAAAHSPVRERGTPPRRRRSMATLAPVDSLSRTGKRCGFSASRQVARSLPWRARDPGKSKPKSRTQSASEEGDEIQEFWGLWWFIPNPDSGRRARVRVERSENLAWIRRDLWESKSFEPGDCYPAKDDDKWDRPPAKLSSAQEQWGDGEKRTFAAVVKEGMAGRGRGRGPRPNLGEDWDAWGGGGGWGYQYPPQQPPPPPPFFGQPPPPFGYFNNQGEHPPQPFHGYQRQHGAPRPRGGGNQSRGRGRFGQSARLNQGAAQVQAQVQATQEGQAPPIQGTGNTQAENQRVDGDSANREMVMGNLQVVCFNCGEIGHMSSACGNPKVCFICHQPDHVVEHCPEWSKPPMAGQYYGSANIGLGFFHIDIEARDNRFRHWKGLDNFGVISIVKGEIGEQELVLNLKSLFDQNWTWQLRKTEDNRYITRFPPSRKVENLVIGRASLFDLDKEGVVASLSVWNGDIEPIGRLDEIWVQVSGIPPKWVDWNTVREVTSSIGLMVELDWQALFNSFFSVVRVKILCKNPAKIPRKRIYAFKKDLHQISFKPEGVEQDESDGDDPEEEELELVDPEENKNESPAKETPKEKGANSNDKGGEQNNSNKETVSIENRMEEYGNTLPYGDCYAAKLGSPLSSGKESAVGIIYPQAQAGGKIGSVASGEPVKLLRRGADEPFGMIDLYKKTKAMKENKPEAWWRELNAALNEM